MLESLFSRRIACEYERKFHAFDLDACKALHALGKSRIIAVRMSMSIMRVVPAHGKLPQHDLAQGAKIMALATKLDFSETLVNELRQACAPCRLHGRSCDMQKA